MWLVRGESIIYLRYLMHKLFILSWKMGHCASNSLAFLELEHEMRVRAFETFSFFLFLQQRFRELMSFPCCLVSLSFFLSLLLKEPKKKKYEIIKITLRLAPQKNLTIKEVQTFPLPMCIKILSIFHKKKKKNLGQWSFFRPKLVDLPTICFAQCRAIGVNDILAPKHSKVQP